VWALYKLSNGSERFTVWTWDKAMRHGAEYSESRGPWSSGKTAVEEMAKKSVLKNLLKYAPKSAEIAQALYTDNAVVADSRLEDCGAEEPVLQFDVRHPPLEENSRPAFLTPRAAI
jgi:recombination protein RecT